MPCTLPADVIYDVAVGAAAELEACGMWTLALFVASRLRLESHGRTDYESLAAPAWSDFATASQWLCMSILSRHVLELTEDTKQAC